MSRLDPSSRSPRPLPRLRLDPWEERFRSELVRLGSDPRVTTFIGDGSPWPRKQAEERHERCLEHWRTHGFGWRGIIDEESGGFLGVAAANYLHAPVLEVDTSAVEIGWWTDPEHWGRGIATHAARIVRDESFRDIDSDVLVARLHRDNIASATVARNTGLDYRGDFTTELGTPAHLYALNRVDWVPSAR
ncbi:GNAT family N-acetyltransferase [Spiractinospora alimapuensis]|uniref:GNAT family N-acetyltransferase n=1 Tax=Spiractinospora alimapuensis TaxID=2820884 RepID=UPI001F377358|nr:GNAT family N-acetyltransferase [Spiractinospora alimapuensis]